MSDKSYPTVLELQKRVDELWQKVEEHFANSPWNKPQPVADDAAVEALMDVQYCNDATGREPCYALPNNSDCAKAILAAIRAGKVPGVVTTDMCSDLINEHARAMNERDTARERVKVLEGLLSDVLVYVMHEKRLGSASAQEDARRILAALGKDKP